MIEATPHESRPRFGIPKEIVLHFSLPLLKFPLKKADKALKSILRLCGWRNGTMFMERPLTYSSTVLA